MSAQPSFELPRIRPDQTIDDDTVWLGRDFPDDRSWVHALEPAMVEEIVAATEVARRGGLAPHLIKAASFPLPRCAELIAAMHREIDAGPGFVLMSGFPIDAFSPEDLRLAYCGFCSHLGNITLQNREGEYILEVTDKGKAYDIQSRGYHSTAHLDFHNDGTNTVTLLCLDTAADGGRSMLVSGTAIYNTILAEHPEHLTALHRGFHHHRRNQKAAGEAPVTAYRTPVFGFFRDLFHMAYAGPSIFYCEQEGVSISAAERAALACFVEVAERPEMRISMELRRGDLQLVNNYLILHARTAYRDSDTQRRQLLRLWLDDERSARLGPGKMDWYLPEHSRFTLSGRILDLEHT